jgi:hypothetical protein
VVDGDRMIPIVANPAVRRLRSGAVALGPGGRSTQLPERTLRVHAIAQGAASRRRLGTAAMELRKTPALPSAREAPRCTHISAYQPNGTS